MSVGYYDQNADAFFERTAHLDMNGLYTPFLEHLPRGAHILDAGCGSGRDSKAFAGMGYRVTSFDASAELVKRARQFTGLDIQHRSFDHVTEESVYDGIWASASLLHVPLDELPAVLKRLSGALKPGGWWYLSFKYGAVEREADGRHFTDLDETGLSRLVDQLDGVTAERMWITEDKRPDRTDHWLNALLKK